MSFSHVGGAEGGALDPSKVGLLVVNLGSPDAPTPAALKRYLAEFLADRRVVELSRLLWLPILHGIILNTRPKRSAKLYQNIWTPQGAPLLTGTQAIADQLANQFADEGVVVAMAMRYGQPSVALGLQQLRRVGCGRLMVLPLYPQYSASTTASIFDAVFAELSGWRVVPPLRTIGSYCTHPAYISALAGSVRRHWQQHGRNQLLLISFHGIPVRYRDAGDPYESECRQTAELLASELQLLAGEWQLSFQSRFGKEPWLTPYTDETLQKWGSEGVASVDVICPGFACDCLETSDEIARENRHLFLTAGGKAFAYIPALGADESHLALLAELVRHEAAGWLTAQKSDPCHRP